MMAMELAKPALIELEEFREFDIFEESPSAASLPVFVGLAPVFTAAVELNKNDLAKWLISACEAHCSSTSSIFSGLQLATEVIKVFEKTGSGQEGYVQERLFELTGEAGIEFMFDLMGKKQEIGQLNVDDVNGVDSTNASISATPDLLALSGFDEDYLAQERLLGLQGGNPRARPPDLTTWRDGLSGLVYHEKKGLPPGAKRTTEPGFEEVFIPAPQRIDRSNDSDLIEISTLEGWAQMAFPGTQKLNRIQSTVFDTAYHSIENMLVCAPTGAGKTNIAMLTVLQLLKQHICNGVLNKSAVKAIYIAPMKALAQEVVSKFSERLKPLGLIVRECTGDMQLSKQEIAESQLLVTTPEKYDVMTRKGGDGSLGTLVNLIIIDEVHLLADDRGAVIETIVARTQRYIESAQRFIRIVGLSATLPNYHDVSTFLRVNAKTGLYFFGPDFRPVPLDQTFIGVTEKQKYKRNDQMNLHAYKKMVAALERGKQVMIFVHSRKETSKTAEAMRDLAAKFATSHLLENIDNAKYSLWKTKLEKSRNVEVQNLFYKGLGIHHAGMLRPDRTLTEQLFESGLIKVLCCTATLAWGVNLPAHTVIIKGTELYDPERGGFVDLGILDVLQIFGRAGRPQYDNSGHAILITPHKTLNKYLDLMGLQAPIESGFIKSLADHLNAEVVNGTINNIKEAATWLSYTFLFVRMCRNPVAYGLSFDDVFTDPQLNQHRLSLVTAAARTLDDCMMVRYDPRSGNLAVTDLGRVASHYYLRHDTISAFNTMLTAYLNDSEALHVLCSSSEFDQLKVRPEELEEIDQLKKHATVAIKGPVEETAGKVCALLQTYLSQGRINSFTLQSDTNYVAQNAGRIARALFEICLKRGWSSVAGHFLDLCKSIDRRVRSDQSPLRQFVYDELPRAALQRLEQLGTNVNTLIDMTPGEIGQLCHDHKCGAKILSLVQKLPHLQVDVVPRPITRNVLRLQLSVSIDFDWSDRYHGSSEPFWIWVEDGENEYVYHSEHFLLQKKLKNQIHELEFTIPIRELMPPQYFVRTVSDRWVGCSSTTAVSFQHLILPNDMPPQTDLLNLHPIPKSALENKAYEDQCKFTHFNPIQTQVFHAVYHTDVNILIGAPTGSGKTVTAEMAILRLQKTRPKAKAIYVAPLKALARERLEDWQQKLGRCLGLRILELTGDVTPEMSQLNQADILIVTPEKWDSISRGWQHRTYVQRVALVIIDEIHLLGVDRGPVLEVIVSRMRFIARQTSQPIRFMGLSIALANPRDLADWLGIGQVGVYNFRPSVRPIPMSIHIQGFPGKFYCPRMATMNKPAFAAIREHSPEKPALVFVSSRRQTRLTALDLISYCAADDNPKQFLHMPEDEITAIASTFRDKALADAVVFGVGIHHAGLDSYDRKTVEELFLQEKIQVLVCTSTLAWGVNLPCHLVIVKGTEYFDGKTSRYVDFPVTDVLQMMGRAGRPQFDTSGVACIFVHDPKKNFYRKFLHEPFPVESSLQHQLHEHINAEIVAGVLTSVEDCLEFLTWTYFYRRLMKNPSYYELKDVSPGGVRDFLIQMVKKVIQDLSDQHLILIHKDDGRFEPTPFGRITSVYYLNYRTVSVFLGAMQQLKESLYVRNSSLEDKLEALAKLLCSAFEFSELPVRHNEDLLNGELAEELPWSVDESTLGDPRTKAFLLLQAHFFRKKLPIVDYINDTKLVLDQAPRVLNAFIDAAAECGYLWIVLDLMKLSQMIYQGVDVTCDEMQQLPWENNQKSSQPDLQIAGQEFLRSKGIRSLKDCAGMDLNTLRQLLSRASLIPGDVVDALCTLPWTGNANYQIKQPIVGSIDPNASIWKKIEPNIEGTSIRFTEGTSCEILMEVTVRKCHKVYTPRYHKPKSSNWWHVLGTSTGDLLALNRLGNSPGKQMLALQFLWPRAGESSAAKLISYFVCDSMVGLDRQDSLFHLQSLPSQPVPHVKVVV